MQLISVPGCSKTYKADVRAAQLHRHSIPIDLVDGGNLALVRALENYDAIPWSQAEVLYPPSPSGTGALLFIGELRRV
jgi:hypothetical protein